MICVHMFKQLTKRNKCFGSTTMHILTRSLKEIIAYNLLINKKKRKEKKKKKRTFSVVCKPCHNIMWTIIFCCHIYQGWLTGFFFFSDICLTYMDIHCAYRWSNIRECRKIVKLEDSLVDYTFTSLVEKWNAIRYWKLKIIMYICRYFSCCLLG